MSTEEIFNFIRINEKIGTAGQPTKAQLKAARDEGYEAIINLAPEIAENHAIEDEIGVVNTLGLEYYHIPVEWNNPKVDDFDKFTKAVDELSEKKVLIHCAANFRVTAFFSLYAMKQYSWSVDQADQLISKVWESMPEYPIDNTWKSFISHIRGTL